jgi:hypothetical protein
MLGISACGSPPPAPSAQCVTLENDTNGIVDQQATAAAAANRAPWQNGNPAQVPQETWQALNDAYNNAFGAWEAANCPWSTMPKPAGW